MWSSSDMQEERDSLTEPRAGSSGAQGRRNAHRHAWAPTNEISLTAAALTFKGVKG
jgi:hypothetical protein